MAVLAGDVRPALVHDERPSAFKLTVILVCLLVVASFAPRAWSWWENRSPYSAGAVDAHVTMSITHAGDVQSTIDAIAGGTALTAPPARAANQQYVVGRVSFRTPQDAPSNGRYAIFLIDARLNRSVAVMYGIGKPGTDVGHGWDSGYDKIPRRYPLLSGLASHSGDEADQHMAVAFPPNTPGPISFVAMLDPDALPITDIDTQIVVALAFESANHTLHWATRLTR